ncbi:hypothetical protein D3C81_1602660 [compost metagenome]
MPPQHGGAGNRHRVEAFNDAPLLILKQAVRRIGDAACHGNQENSGQQVIHIVLRPALDGAAQNIYKQQHHGNRSNTNREDGVHTPHNMAHGAPEHNAHIA